MKFCLSQVSEIEVFLLLKSLDMKMSFGIDKVHPLLLKSGTPQMCHPLTYINLKVSNSTKVFFLIV